MQCICLGLLVLSTSPEKRVYLYEVIFVLVKAITCICNEMVIRSQARFHILG